MSPKKYWHALVLIGTTFYCKASFVLSKEMTMVTFPIDKYAAKKIMKGPVFQVFPCRFHVPVRHCRD